MMYFDGQRNLEKVSDQNGQVNVTQARVRYLRVYLGFAPPGPLRSEQLFGLLANIINIRSHMNQVFDLRSIKTFHCYVCNLDKSQL